MRSFPIILTVLITACAPRESLQIRVDTLAVPVPAIAETVKVYEIQHPNWTWAGVGARVESVFVNVPGRTVFVKSRPETLKILHTDTVKITTIQRPEQTPWEWVKDRAFFILLGIMIGSALIVLLRFKIL